VGTISGLLVTVRTARQGAEMVSDKHGAPYIEEISTLRVHRDDLAALGLEDGGRAALASEHGEIRVFCKAAETPRGLFFLPLGPVANVLFSVWSAQESGVPNWKGIEVTITGGESPDKPVGPGQGGES